MRTVPSFHSASLLSRPVLIGALGFLACQDPTQIRLHIRTDVPHDSSRLLAVTACPPPLSREKSPDIVAEKPWAADGDIGTLVVLPDEDPKADIAIGVVLGVARDPTECTLDDPDGCIFTRRKLQFLEHRSLELPIALHAVCEGVPCDEDRTCNALGECVPADIDPEGCGEPGSQDCLPPGDLWPPQLSWGEYAETLDVPSCPSDSFLLVVNDASYDLEGGEELADPAEAGPTLSFVEAMWIAYNNAPRAHAILFDSQVFPKRAPKTIQLPMGVRFPTTTPMQNLCLDGRGRGVVLRWDPVDALGSRPGEIWRLGEGSLQVGLTLLHTPFSLFVVDAQVAGCRFNTDGVEVFEHGSFWNFETRGTSTLGPGIVLAGHYGLDASGTVLIQDSFVGYDPITRRRVPLLMNLIKPDPTGPTHVTIRRTVLALDGDIQGLPSGPTDDVTFVLENNYLGVDHRGELLDGMLGIGAREGRWIIGPGNILRGTTGVFVSAGALATITGNSIFGNASGIVHEQPAPVLPPTVVSVSETQAGGMCEGPGVVELFSDLEDQGEIFLGSGPCDGTWQIDVPIPAGRNVTATWTDALGSTSAFSEPVRP